MIELDAKSAADRIRGEVLGRPDIPAEARHALAFTKAVCAELGIEPDPPNMMAVAQALQKADIKPHVVQEYPKMLTDDKGKPVRNEDGVVVIFNSAEDETAYKPADAPKIVPVEPHTLPETPPKYEPLPKALEALDDEADDRPKRRK